MKKWGSWLVPRALEDSWVDRGGGGDVPCTYRGGGVAVDVAFAQHASVDVASRASRAVSVTCIVLKTAGTDIATVHRRTRGYVILHVYI